MRQKYPVRRIILRCRSIRGIFWKRVSETVKDEAQICSNALQDEEQACTNALPSVHAIFRIVLASQETRGNFARIYAIQGGEAARWRAQIVVSLVVLAQEPGFAPSNGVGAL